METAKKELLPNQQGSRRKRPVILTNDERYNKKPEIKFILTRKKNFMDIPVNTKKTYTPEEKREFAQMKKRQETLREIMLEVDLEAVFIQLNGERRSKGKWYIPDFGLVINKGQSWNGVSDTQGRGFGGSEFVKLHFNFSYEMEALEWMVSKFGEEIDESLKVDLNKPIEKNDFNPPDKNPEFTHIGEAYLIEKRGLAPSIVRNLIETDKLYVDDRRRCVFLAEASAEVRSTHESLFEFKGTVEGSQVDISGFTVLPQWNVSERVLSKVEAAIDAISNNILFPGRFELSTNGAGRFELQYKTTTEAIDNGYGVSLAYDADDAGDLAAQREFNAIYLREKISKEFGVDKVVVDEWFLHGVIRLNPDISEHHLFFNGEWADERRVSVKKTRVIPDPEKENGTKTEVYWEPTDEFKAPEIVYTIARDLLDGKIPKGKNTIPVSKRAVDYIQNVIGIKRDRPLMGKDWNAELVKLGSAYITEYERCAENGFKELPKLPEHLEKMRREIKPVILNQSQEVEVSKPVEQNKSKPEENNIPVNNTKPESEIKNEAFTTSLSRQEIFNSLYVRFNLNKKLGIDYSVMDENIKNKDIEFFISSSPHLSFVNEGYEPEKAIIYEDEGQFITSGEYSPPTIQVRFNKGLNERIKDGQKVNFKVSQEGFDYVIKYMDKMSEYLEKSKDWKGALSRMNAGFIEPVENKNSNETLRDILGNGKLFEDLKEAVNNNLNNDYDYNETDIGMSDDSYASMLENYTQLNVSDKEENNQGYRKPQMK